MKTFIKPSRFPLIPGIFGLLVLLTPARLPGQMLEPRAASNAPDPMADPTMKPGKAFLFELESKFAKDVGERGGAGFADWFAEDGVALGNGAAPLVGIAAGKNRQAGIARKLITEHRKRCGKVRRRTGSRRQFYQQMANADAADRREGHARRVAHRGNPIERRLHFRKRQR